VTWTGHNLLAGETIAITGIDQDGWKNLNGTTMSWT